MGLNKEAWAKDEQKRKYLATMREGRDYSGFRSRFRTSWLCRTCGTIVAPGKGHGHAR